MAGGENAVEGTYLELEIGIIDVIGRQGVMRGALV